MEGNRLNLVVSIKLEISHSSENDGIDQNTIIVLINNILHSSSRFVQLKLRPKLCKVGFCQTTAFNSFQCI